MTITAIDKKPLGAFSKVSNLKRSDGKDIHVIFELRASTTAAAIGGAGTGSGEWAQSGTSPEPAMARNLCRIVSTHLLALSAVQASAVLRLVAWPKRSWRLRWVSITLHVRCGCVWLQSAETTASTLQCLMPLLLRASGPVLAVFRYTGPTTGTSAVCHSLVLPF